MYNELILVSVTPFSGTSDADKNGNYPVMLQCIAGRMPNRNVLSGTVAQRAGFEVGKTYLVNCRETGFDTVFGTDYTFVKVKELESGVDIAKTMKELGPPQIFTVGRPEGFEGAYVRKTNAVESIKNERIRKGLYIPALETQRPEHETAKEILEGSTITDASEMQRNLTPADLEKAKKK